MASDAYMVNGLIDALVAVHDSIKFKEHGFDYNLNAVAPNHPTKSNEQSREDTLKDIEESYLIPKHKFSKTWLRRLQQRWYDPHDFQSLYGLAPTTSRTALRFIREGLDGRIVDYKEVSVPANNSTSKNSTSFNRKSATRADLVRGRAGFLPFAAGGVDPKLQEDAGLEEDGGFQVGSDRLLKVAPGFIRGLAHDEAGEDEEDESLREDTFQFEDVRPLRQVEHTSVVSLQDNGALDNAEVIDELLPEEFPMLAQKLPLAPSSIKSKEKNWAHVVDMNQELTNYSELVPNPARTYPFELDNFQKEAIYHLENGDSVFVAAHTSAGKTAVAEYAIALAAKHMTKAIYTSPIKALSNQKFRDFRQTFEDVGILTGDVQINAEASCLIMTTEILRSMLYRGADLIRDVEYVIFDEVHYVNDLERGVVWEEVIIMLPEHVSLILLSATVPNTKEFANWVGRTKKQEIYVISTPKRPVPLEHFLWTKKKLFKVVDSNKSFVGKGYKMASEALSVKQDLPQAGRGRGQEIRGRAERGDRGPGRGLRGGGRGGRFRPKKSSPDENTWVPLIQYLHKFQLLPVVIFVFSKKKCEMYADMLPNIDFCSAREKSEIHVTIEKSIARLKAEDRQLPQIQRIRLLLAKGLAVHHGGLLPIVKEMVEILFARGLVKVLFATETFAMGLNLPTRTVCFSGTRKHDGQSFRDLLTSEYTQMAGRAGRRGLDKTGTVIIIANDEVPPVNGLYRMVLGSPDKLQSQFRLSYNMILNLARVEALRIEEMIRRSFSENASQIMLPEHEQNVLKSEADLEKLKKNSCPVCIEDLKNCHDICESIKGLNEMIVSMAINNVQGKRILGVGRVIMIQERDKPRTIGIVLSEIRASLSDRQPNLQVLMVTNSNVNKRSLGDLFLPIPAFLQRDIVTLPKIHRESTTRIAAIPLQSVELVTSFVVATDVLAIRKRNREAITAVRLQISEILGVYPRNESVEVDWSKIKNLEFRQLCESKQSEEASIMTMKSIQCRDFGKHVRTRLSFANFKYAQYHEEFLLRLQISALKQMLSDQNLELLPDYEGRVSVLKEFNFLDESSTVQLKGRVACEINSAHELVLTELILENFLADYEPEEIVALLSCFVFHEKTDVEPTMSPKLQRGKAEIIKLAKMVSKVQEKYQVLVATDDLEFETRPRFGLVEVVYEWARGMSFNSITDLTDVLEGTIVRVITRLDETCREVKSAARIVGDAALYEKMQEAQDVIKRDLVFATSLYY